MRIIKKIGISFLAVMMLVGSFYNPVVASESKQLYLDTNIDKTLDIPLTLTSSTDTFYVDANINPGDIMSADVVFKNSSKEEIQIRISDVADQLNTTNSAALLEVLQLSISTNGSPIYKGSHKNVTSPLTQWITLNGGSVLTMNIKIEFPKSEADNKFQGSEMKVKYVFEARADVPLDELNSQKLKTGIEEETSSNPVAIVLTVVTVLIGIILIASFVIGKKKNQKNDK